MTESLRLNPFLQLETVGDGSEDLILVGPKRGAGTQSVRLERTSRPQLFEVLTELAATSLDFLEPEKDLLRDDIDFLRDHGFLVDPSEVPKMPSFACSLDEIEVGDLVSASRELRVSKDFEFDPFDLTTFTSKIQESHLSPFRPIAWTRSLVFGVKVGYWLNPADAEIVSGFLPGEAVSGLDPVLCERLLEAEILLDAGGERTAHRQQLLDRAGSSFRTKGYGVIEGLLPPHQMKAYRDFYRDYVSEGFMPFGDPQVRSRYRQHNEPLAAFLHKSLQPLMSLMAGVEVIPSYVYAASYKDGAVLDPHVDRPQCEYSISFQVDYEPETTDQISPWALCVEPLGETGISDIGWDTINADAARKFNLASGDALFYKGCELVHYRSALPDGARSTSLFFHFVPADFSGSLD